MNYIINPSWFYWMSVADGMKTLLLVFAAVLFITETVLIVLHFVCKSNGVGYGEDDSDNIMAKALVKPIKLVGFFTLIVLFSCLFLPSRNTLIEMQIARYATYENAEWTVETIKSAVDYIVNAIQSLK